MTSERPLEERIGEIVRTVRFPIEAGKIGEFARAMRDPAKIYGDPARAKTAGFDAVPAPLTFSVAAALYSGGDAADLPIRLGLDLKRTVHGEQRWIYHRPVVAGDVLTGTTRIAAVDRKPGRGGEMLRILFETNFADEAGAPVVTEQMLTIELPAG